MFAQLSEYERFLLPKNICVSQTHFQILRIFAPGRYSYQKPIEIMNKKLFEKIKSLCKDTGLSEKYLKAITEKLGGSIEDGACSPSYSGG